MSLSWKPKRKGLVYCSPACGAGCTHAAYTKAHKLADALVKKCQKEAGGKWEKRVHENLGWHYSVNLKGGNLSISENGYLGLWKSKAPYDISFGGGTPSVVFIKGNSKSIKRLVAQQLKAIKNEADRWNDCLKGNKKALGHI